MATVSPASASAQKAPGNEQRYVTFTVTPVGTGNCQIIVTDKKGHVASIPVTVAFEQIYVRNYYLNVAVYPLAASYHDAPTRIIGGPGKTTTMIDSGRGLAVDRSGRIYLTNRGVYYNSGNPYISVFAADASGNIAPERILTGSNTKLSATQSIAVDADGTLYDAEPGAILVFAPGASGNVAPVREISGSATGLSTTAVTYLAIGSTGKIYAATSDGAIEVYASDATGDAAPLTTIKGSETGLEPGAIAVDSSGKIYVANNHFSGPATLSVFAASASGNVAPLSTISTYNYNTLVGVGVDTSGNIYAGVQCCESEVAVAVYPPTAHGIVMPIRTLSEGPGGPGYDQLITSPVNMVVR